MKLPRWLARLAAPEPRAPTEEQPLDPAAARALGLKWLQEGDAERAETALRLAVHVEPQAVELHLQLAEALRRLGKHAEALASCQDAVGLAPLLAEAHNNLGNAYQDLGDARGALAAFRKAIELDGGLAEAHLNLGIALYQEGAIAPARDAYQAAIRLRPALAQAHLNLGYLEERHGAFGAALGHYEDAIAADPQLAEAHFNCALQLLVRGDYARGWEEYEWRRALPQWRGTSRQSSLPEWNGQPLSGETLLLHAEQGFGDAIQFVRYAPMAAARGAKVILQCQPNMKALFASLKGVASVVGFDEEAPAADLCCPLLTLPRLFGTTVESVPANVPYLYPDEQRRRHWRQRLASDAGLLKVGLFWATGSPAAHAGVRSLSLGALEPLARVAGVAYYSLQRGAVASQAAQPPAGMRITDLAPELQGFADDAALLAELDLVISIDTALAHLGGALACPTWTLMQFPPDWRWGLAGETTPWYPAMRLFRQQRAGEWQGAVARLALELRALAERRAMRPTF